MLSFRFLIAPTLVFCCRDSRMQDKNNKLNKSTAEDKAPTRSLAFYGRMGIWIALLFISIGLTMQSVQINLFTQENLDREYSEAMAQQVAQSIQLKLEETLLQQQKASQHILTLNAVTEPDPVWANTLKSMITGAENIFILNRFSAFGLQEKLGYAVQDIVTRTLKGEERPLEAVKRNGKIHFYQASPIRDQLNVIQGILLIEYGAKWLQQLQTGTASHYGLIATHQSFDQTQKVSLELFSSGTKDSKTLMKVITPINKYWYVEFYPSDKRPQLSVMPLISAWIFSLVATLISLFIFLWLQIREIEQNQLKLLTYVRQLFRKDQDSFPDFSLKLFHNIAKSMQHLASSKRITEKSHAYKQEASVQQREPQQVDLTAPKRKPASLAPSLNNTGIEVEEIEHIANVSSNIFRAYDIRGIVGVDLNEDVAYAIGTSLGTEVLEKGHSKISIGWDGRNSSPSLAKGLEKGILSTGCDVIRLGAIPTGMLYFATHEFDTECGVMVTGSHNPADYNGFKIVINKQTLAKEALSSLHHRLISKKIKQGNGSVEDRNAEPSYIQHIQQDIHFSRPIKVVFDAGNGIGGPTAQALFKPMGVNMIPLYCEVDGNFPNHHPDPSQPHNLADLQKAVLEHQADVGIAFDGDADRIAVVDNKGQIIWPDRLLMYFAKDIISRNPGCDILYDIKCSRRVNQVVTAAGGRATMWKTGHSLMKAKMNDSGALLGGELSGHLYFADRWHGFDDGIYVAARLLELLSQNYTSTSEIFAEFPDDISTPEITISTTDDKKFQIIHALSKEASLQQGARVSTIDGLRCDYANGWGLVRASNTTPKLTLRFAADNNTALAEIQNRFRSAIQKAAPELDVPF